MTSFYSDKVPQPPRESGIFLRADYWELRALLSLDRQFSRDNWAEVHEEEQDLAVDAEWDEYSQDDAGTTEANNPQDHYAAADTWTELNRRAKRFSEDYPFEIVGNVLKLRTSTLARKQYLFLLLCASLRYVEKTKQHVLTSAFESLSCDVFKLLMPKGAEVHRAGKHALSRYQGHAYDKLVALASDFRGKPKVAKNDFAPTDSGDNGFDLVAWHGMGDMRDFNPKASAQVGCGVRDGFGTKPLEGTHAANTIIDEEPGWSSYYFTPLDLHAAANNWHRRSDLKKVIYVDRLRLLRLAKTHELPVNDDTQAAIDAAALPEIG